MTYDDAWVDEVSRGFRACSVFLWYPLYCSFRSSFGSA
jgi:proton-dependent oligopeptide transporter, POT family